MAELNKYSISGIIYDEFNSPLANAKVKIYEVDLRTEKLLGDVATDAKGNYRFGFPAELTRPEYNTPDIIITIQKAGLRAISGKSSIYFNIKPEITINYRIGDSKVLPINEFERLVALLSPLLKDSELSFDQLEETTDKNKDISFLSGETGEDFEKILFLNTAFVFAKGSMIAADIFYALLRMGFPAVMNELLMIKAESLRKGIKQAIDENIISSKWGKEMDKIITVLNSLSVKRIINGNDEQSTSVKKLFGAAFTPEQQAVFTGTYLANEETPELFWDKLKGQTGFNASEITKAKQLLSFNLLTDNQPELAHHLFSNQSSDADLKELSGYAKFTNADWQEQIKKAAVVIFPAWVKGETGKDKTIYFADSLEQLHKQLYPTAFFSARMKQDDQSAFELKTQLNSFFKKNPEFELGIKNINKQLADANFENANNKEALKKELKIINRLYSLTNGYKQINALYEKQIFSSSDIVTKFGREQFLKQFTNIMVTAEAATTLYKKSVSINNKTTALITAYKTRSDIKVYAINGDAPDPEGYYEMFNDRELCECEHCQSVYSPAAYFVDMLSFIKRESSDAYNELLRRRPDLEHIRLTCKNTNTSLPYIDLVNELLEKEVISLSIPEDEKAAFRTQSFQTEQLAAELNTTPEHINNNAYAQLKIANVDAIFSAKLPLDLPFEEINLYAEKLGIRRHEFMEAFHGNNTPDLMNDVSFAATYFGFSNTELNIISGANAFVVTLPSKINEVLDKTKLSYIELLQLLETYFLNPVNGGDRRITVVQESEEPILTCNLDKLILDGGNDAWLNKAVRFTRLWKKIGWDIFDLDRALTVLGVTDFPATETAFNEQLLIPFAHIEKIKTVLRIPLRQAITFFGNIDSARYLNHSKESQPEIPSLYHQLFQDKTVIENLPNSPFSATAENLSGILLEHGETISAVLGITAQEFALLEPAAELSHQTISRLYRDVLLAQSLKETMADTKKIISITGKNATDGIWNPVLLAEFLEKYHVFKASSINIGEFDSIIRSNTSADYLLAVDNNLVDFVQQHRDVLNVIKNDTANTKEQRITKYAERLKQFLNELSVKDVLLASLGKDLISLDDITLKTEIEKCLGDKNKQALELLSGDELIEKLDKLKVSMSDYLLLKTTPQIFKQFRFLPDEIKWLENNKAATDTDKLWESLIDTNNTEIYPAFSRLLHIWRISKIKTDTTISWTGLFDTAINDQPDAKAAWFEKFISLFAVAEASLLFLCGEKNDIRSKGKLNFNFPDDYTDAENILSILNCSNIIEKLGGNNGQLNALLNPTVSDEDAGTVKNLLKSKYESSEWSNVIKPINDGLRTKRRDALVAWLLANNPNNAWRSLNDMYEWLLIDAEMDVCMMTSRLKQGISSIQLFIDRCLMNLETTPILATDDEDDVKKIILGTEFSEQWHSWRKQYRVWEANRKIFLYPENWIEPDLRDDKSPFFKELESQLKQNEVTEETAKDALITYLQKLDSVANLEMVGLFNDEETKIVHVFGRTQNIPHQYFYRKEENSAWTAWEKMDLDIEGDHILPVVWNGRLMLFWGAFTEKQKETGGSTNITPEGESGSLTMSSTPAPKYLEMKLAWSEYKSQRWGVKKISKESVYLSKINTQIDSNVSGLEALNYISMDFVVDESKLQIIVSHVIDDGTQRKSYATFLFESCFAAPLKIYADAIMDRIISDNFKYDKMFVLGGYSNSLKLFPYGIYQANESIGEDEKIILNGIPGSYSILPEHVLFKSASSNKFFYVDKKYTFYIKSTVPLKMIRNDNSAAGYQLFLKRKVMSPIRDRKTNNGNLISKSEKKFKSNFFKTSFLFQIFNYPFVCDHYKELNNNGIGALYSLSLQNRESIDIFQGGEYINDGLVRKPYPKEEVDFSYTGSYSLYNWELFFQVPLLIATRLTKNQKFEEARKWFHYIFDPTKSSNGETGAERFWITKPFRKEIQQNVFSLDDLLNMDDSADELDVQLDNWEKNPFNPHAVARLRVSAYMRNTVFRYIDNLIQWGDQLFKRDTIESINEATLLYILASNILGSKQESVPPRVKPVEESFSDIKNKLDGFSNVKADIETFFSPSSGEDDISMPYFCLPKNDYLLKYWDTVADRLLKIRHCMNIEGMVRQLPLFEPPIDPALLIRATAAGLDLNTILDDMNIILPNYRFQVMLQQANQLCSDVKSLGGMVLSVIEKKDAEEIALLRSVHGYNMLEMIKDVKQMQKDDAKESLGSLLASRITIEERLSYYNKNVSVNLNASEKLYFSSTNLAINTQSILEMKNYLASALAFTPEFKLGSGFTIGSTFGGSNLAKAADFAANALQSVSSLNRLQAESANMKGGYDRRLDEWKFQSKSAELELKQIDKLIIAAEIRLAIAEKEIENHNLQMEQSREVDNYMRSKFTNAELYDWMVGQISTVYFQSYQLAYASAKKAEKCLQHELGLEATNYVQFGYWDSLKKGLLSGEKLQYDLRRLENAFLEENKREYEIVKHVSLSMLDPLALIKLQSTGSCDFKIPEVIYDVDFPGQYFRRIKSVSINLPCIAGPYVSINSKLSLTNSSHRKVTSGETYAEDGLDDPRFNYNRSPIQSIATSNAQNDSGVFELNFRDERYLPFEGTGAISSWKLELPTAVRQFDYNTIADLILHVKYTARDGGDVLKSKAEGNLNLMLGEIKQAISQTGLHIAINMKHDMPNEWQILRQTGSINLKIDKSRLPYMAQSIVPNAEIESVMFITKIKDNPAVSSINVDDVALNLARIDDLELCGGIKEDIDLNVLFKLSVSNADKDKLEELLLIIKYKF